MLDLPPLCPRCGNRDFEQATINLSESNRFEVRAGVLRCTQCSLSFDGKTWRDENNQEWTMAESGE